MEIRVNQDDINEHIIKAITNSMVGVQFEKALNEAFKNVVDGYNSPIKDIVRRAISGKVEEFLNLEENKTLIMGMVKKHLTEDFMKQIVEKFMARILFKAGDF